MSSRYERAIDTKLDILRSIQTEEYRELTENSLFADISNEELSVDEFIEFTGNMVLTGKTYYVPDEMGRILVAAANQLPTFTLQPHDVPTKIGFVYLETPIHEASNDSVHDFDMYHRAIGWAASESGNGVVVVYFASRHDIMPWLERIFDSAYAKAKVQYGAATPQLTASQKMDWICRQAPPWATFHWTNIYFDRETTLDVLPNNVHARYVLAMWFMLAQEAVEPVEQQPPRQARKRAQRAKTNSNLTVVYLRGMRHADQHHSGEEGTGTKLTHRFPVSGHWRRQWYPSEQRHRPKWIAPYIKGPQDGELIVRDKVNVLCKERD